MDKKPTQKSCLAMPPLLYGTAWKEERTTGLVQKAVLHGFRGIDTACQPKHYNEAGVGQALKLLKAQGIEREELFLQTKFTPLDGQDPTRVPYDPSASLDKQVQQSFGASLKNLGVSTIEALLLHAPLHRHEQTMSVWRAMEELHQQGVVRMLGISNCYALEALQRIDADAAVKPSIVQNRFYRNSGYDKPLRNWCRDRQIHYQSFWTLTANPHILSHPVLLTIARDKEKTPEQIFLRFLTIQEITPLIGACSEVHMAQDLAIFDFDLDDQEMQKVDSLLVV